jgi:hypothetical protein
MADPQAVQRFQMMEVLIRRQAEDDEATVVCRRCGRLESPSPGGWEQIAGAAQQHADERGKGHLVAVMLRQGAVFRPENGKEQ